MILYYTGTGNSRHLARILAEKLEDELVSAAELIREGRTGDFCSEKPWVFVCPTYGWQIPHIFRDFIREASFTGSREAWFVMNCGSEIGNAAQGIRSLCDEKGFRFHGVMQIKMPENYIAMFSAPSPETAEKLIRIGGRQAERAAKQIAAGQDFPEPPVRLLDKLYSGPVNAFFYRFCIGDKKFYTTGRCISCGKCTESCLLHNISLEKGRPVWHGSCTHCMACINLCPTQAIEYGKHSVGLRRYYLK